jgi:flagellar assembly protein FliH
MAYPQLVAFSRPLANAVIAGREGRFYLEAELAERDQSSYRRGVDSTRALADQQMVEMRSDLAQLSDGILKKIAACEPVMMAQLREALPALALDLARRLLAGYEPSAETVSRICEEALGELFPERENLELSVSPRDATLLTGFNPEWMQRYPGLRVLTDSTLSAGDCQVRSRFGLTDARQQTKLASLAHSLAAS